MMTDKNQDVRTANKTLVQEFFTALSTGPKATLPLLDEKVIWWTAPAVYNKAEWAKVETSVWESLATPVVVQVTTLTAEDDRVAAETESHGILKSGRVYANKYCWLFRIRNGRILRIHEHCDTYHAVKTYEGVLPLYEGHSASLPVPAAWPPDLDSAE
jgi:uncharacterized protein